ncbi:MAG: UDP-3-O-(3-hydroxymyristoyl)glucosamine N-acyltransferase [Bacteroidetes bacterium]|nr:UDP-3-O-(3-hydroxymyristoyl)glucosamine N-acyltransferase [Bacteroidota bacterium]
MKVTAQELAYLLQGEVVGDEQATIDSISKIDQSLPNTLSFLANPKYEEYIYTCQSAIVLVSKDFTPKQPITTTLIKVSDPYAAFTLLLEKYAEQSTNKTGVEQPSFVADSAVVGENTYIGAFTYIAAGVEVGNNTKIFPNVYIGEGVVIGENCIIYAGVKIYYGCKVGSNCIIHAGTVIGSDGFGHAPQADGTYKKIPQTGNVVIENNIEIGANCTIDRATIGSTIIRNGVKLDNLIQVAHNVEIGENTVIASQTGISGSASLGKNCMIGGQVGFVGHIKVADGSKIGAQSGIMKDIKEADKAWIGSPIYEIKESFKMQAVYRNLPEMQKRINDLERMIEEIKNK